MGSVSRRWARAITEPGTAGSPFCLVLFRLNLVPIAFADDICPSPRHHGHKVTIGCRHKTRASNELKRDPRSRVESVVPRKREAPAHLFKYLLV
ncbi:hypothetical protein BgiBS90_003542 [Biomphalaria glabrata]|nr:hypothetical protein BgiBS90_003542 [Biomphalaria glabrata]